MIQKPLKDNSHIKSHMLQFQERCNLEMAKYLYTINEDTFKSFYPRQKDEKSYKLLFKQLKGYLKLQLFKEYEHSYYYANGLTHGRMYSNGLQGLPKVFRGALCNDIMTDIDLVNAHPNILLYVCKKQQIACPMLEKYVESRNDILDDFVNDIGITREQAKTYFLKATNSNMSVKIKYHFLNAYDKEMKKIQNILVQHKEYQKFTPNIETKEFNQQGSFINHIMCYYENLILQDLVKYLQERDFEIAVLAFDGLMIYGNHYHNTILIDEISSFISNKWNHSFKYSYKAHNTTIQIPENHIDDCINTFESLSEKYSKVIYKVGSQYVIHEDNEFIIEKHNDLLVRYGHIGCINAKGFSESFIKQYVGINSPITVFKKMDFYPDNSKCPADHLNVWIPFDVQMYESDYVPNQEGLNAILHHFMILSNHNEEYYNFLLDWCAHMFQYPDIKPGVVPVLISEQGSGKGTLIELFTNLMGQSKVHECANPKRDIWGEFNPIMKSKFLINLDEVNMSDFINNEGVAKHLFTQTVYTLHEKNKNQVDLKSFHRYIITTNNKNPVPTSRGDRRFVITDCSDEYKGNTEYAEKMHSYISDVDILRTFYQYLMSRPNVPKKFNEDVTPKTSYQTTLQNANRDYISAWMEDLLQEQRFDKTELKMSNDEVWESFRIYCSNSNIPLKWSKNQFGTRLGLTKIPGIESTVFRTQTKAIRGRRFDLQSLRKHFEVVDVYGSFADSDEEPDPE